MAPEFSTLAQADAHLESMTKRAKDEAALWRSQSREIRVKAGIASTYTPWTPGKELTGVSAQPRPRDLLDLGFALRQKAMPPKTPTGDIVENFWANISQAHKRKPFYTGLR